MSDGNFLPVGQSWTPTPRLRHPQDPQRVPLPPGPAWDTSLDVPGGMCQAGCANACPLPARPRRTGHPGWLPPASLQRDSPGNVPTGVPKARVPPRPRCSRRIPILCLPQPHPSPTPRPCCPHEQGGTAAHTWQGVPERHRRSPTPHSVPIHPKIPQNHRPASLPLPGQPPPLAAHPCGV